MKSICCGIFTFNLKENTLMMVFAAVCGCCNTSIALLFLGGEGGQQIDAHVWSGSSEVETPMRMTWLFSFSPWLKNICYYCLYIGYGWWWWLLVMILVGFWYLLVVVWWLVGLLCFFICCSRDECNGFVSDKFFIGNKYTARKMVGRKDGWITNGQKNSYGWRR